MYFGHYTRLLYMAQIEDKRLYKKRRMQPKLGLRFDYRFTGYGEFTQFMADLSQNN